MRAVRWHPVAREELLDAATYYKQQHVGLEEEFIAAVQHTVNLLLDFPYLGKAVGPGYRQMLVHRFPYSVIYRVRSKQLQIKGVIHHRLDLQHWIGR